jgi:hypothetical protein
MIHDIGFIYFKQNLGCKVETHLHSQITVAMNRYEHMIGYHVLHSFDDPHLIAAYGR